MDGEFIPMVLLFPNKTAAVNIMIKDNDWRIRWQDEYLKDRHFSFHSFKKYRENWEHEHCEFCWDKISNNPDDLKEGYFTLDDNYFVCSDCFEDFKQLYSMHIFDRDSFSGEYYHEIISHEVLPIIEKKNIFKLEKIIRITENIKKCNLLIAPMIFIPSVVFVSINKNISPKIFELKKEKIIIENCDMEFILRTLKTIDGYLDHYKENKFNTSMYSCIEIRRQ